MNKVKEFNFEISRWFFAKVLENTPFTIILTILFTSFFALYFREIWQHYYRYILGVMILLVVLYYSFSYEIIIKRVRLKPENLDQDWMNNEIRTHIPSTASVTDKALYVQFMDIPFTLKQELPDKYALEFKAKVINICFAWCVNANIVGQNMRAYMFQYNSIEKKLRPHFLMGYDSSRHVTLWVLPDTPNSPLKSLENLSLRSKDGWYFIRTEVYQYEAGIQMPALDSNRLRQIVPVYRDGQNREVTFDRANINKVVEIKIYDMNDLGKNIYHIFFNEPPFKCFWGGKIGFRNYGLESALYKDVIVRDIY